ncbi:MAG TPA: hypothetical protein DCY57_06760 [Bacteroidetes bacterium]|nr:hypothetical protein [Bacteroidota bacterium]
MKGRDGISLAPAVRSEGGVNWVVCDTTKLSAALKSQHSFISDFPDESHDMSDSISDIIIILEAFAICGCAANTEMASRRTADMFLIRITSAVYATAGLTLSSQSVFGSYSR